MLSLAKCEIKIKIQRIAWEILVIDDAMINEHGNACPKQKDHGKCLMNTNIKLIRFSSAVDMNLISTNRIINGSFQKPNYVCDLLNNTD